MKGEWPWPNATGLVAAEGVEAPEQGERPLAEEEDARGRAEVPPEGGVLAGVPQAVARTVLDLSDELAVVAPGAPPASTTGEMETTKRV